MNISTLYFFIALFLLEIYPAIAVKKIGNKSIFPKLYAITSILIVVYLVYSGITLDRKHPKNIAFTLTLIVITYVPKFFISGVLLFEDIYRLFIYLYSKIFKTKAYLPGRRKAISILSFSLASIPFLGIIHGIVWGKFQYTLHKVKLSFPNLPKSFDGYKIVQISDIHLGSFKESQKERIQKGIDLINEQKADLFLFTGDSVNYKAEEILPWLDMFKPVTAKDGKFSIFGNHDYAIYTDFNPLQKEQNLEKIVRYHKQIDWNLLRNKNIKITKGTEFINIIGVENWGVGRFPKAGDLTLATQGINPGEFNILMSHDPTHFDKKVKEFPLDIPLTLSGHTHGMQFGVEIPGIFKWSPIKYIYPKWAGLYKDKGKYLYVNRGFGFLGMSARVGIFPEITVIELQRV